MKRVNFYIPATLLKQVRVAAKSKGISMSEWFRRVLEKHFSKNDDLV